MSTARLAEQYVLDYFRDKKRIDLFRVKRPERGYDFRNADSTLFVEVKGAAAKETGKLLFRYFTNAQYEMAKQCILAKKQYEIHIIVGIGSDSCRHYVVPARKLVERAKPEVSWYFPIRKDFGEFLLDI